MTLPQPIEEVSASVPDDPPAGVAALPSEIDPTVAHRIKVLYTTYEDQLADLRGEVAALRGRLQTEQRQREQILAAMQKLHGQLLVATGETDPEATASAELEEVISAVSRLAKESEQVKGMLKSSLAWFRALTEYSLDVTAIIDARFRFSFLTPSVGRILGLDSDDLLGEEMLDLITPEDHTLAKHWLNNLIARTPGPNEVTLRLRHRDGSCRILELTGNNCLDLEAVNGVVINGRDISERAAAEERIRHLAMHDELTGLPNRNLVRERAQAAMARADREGTLVAFMFLDLDRFKHVNDSLGHQVGDELLRHTATQLTGAVRQVDTVGRLGGDEFLMVFPDFKNADDVAPLAEHILMMLGHAITLEGHDLHASASIGISLYPRDATSLDVLMRNADTAMYQAKSAGRNTYRFFTEAMNSAALNRLRMESRLRRAIREEEFVLYYQPIVSTGSGAVVAAEALVRWKDPEHGLVPPLEFIPVAEELGLIVDIGAWVLREACARAAHWQRNNGMFIPLAVNLSAEQFRTRDLIDVVSRALRDHGLDPRWLHLEITESLLMEHTGQTIAMLGELNKLGVHLSIDDFGTGYSSLSYLTRFPIQKLKIDKTFVRDVRQDHSNVAVTRSVIALGHSLELTVLAEGVETIEQLEFLRANGCDEVQGYYFSRPIPADEFEKLVQGWPATSKS